MAKIVLISNGTFRNGFNNIGDIVSIHDDDVELSGSGYSELRVVQIQATKSEIESFLGKARPKQSKAFKANTTQWSFSKPEEIDVWKDELSGRWKQINEMPKYQLRLSLSLSDIQSFRDTSISQATKLQILQSRLISNVRSNAVNQVEIPGLI